MKLYTIPEAAKACKLSPSMLHRAIGARQLEAVELHGTRERVKRVITEEALLSYKRWRVQNMGDYYPELEGLLDAE